jgi:hypothetical protein
MTGEAAALTTEKTSILLPPGTRLLHIGPQKTGSTALQAALHSARDTLLEHGVVYAGSDTRPRKAGWAVLGTTPRGRRSPDPSAWTRLVEEVREAGDARVLVSNEDFGRADSSVAARIVRELGQGQPHVVLVARRYDRLLPSQWQERVKAGEQLDYESWLRIVLDPAKAGRWRHRVVWSAHDTVASVERWAEHAGMENVTVIVADDADRARIPDTFERLLGLPGGTLRLTPDTANRSLTFAETELVRSVNGLFKKQGWTDEAYHRLVQGGLVMHLRTTAAAPEDIRIPPVPRWAADRVAELNAARVDGLRQSGVRVIGDLGELTANESSEEDIRPPAMISLAAASTAMEGTLRLAMKREKRLRQRLL